MPTQLQHKAAHTASRVAPKRAIKLADEGVVVAIVAVTGVVDAVQDLLVPGCFAASLKVRRPKICSDHDWARKTGRVLHILEWMPGDRRLPKRTKDGRPWPAEAGALVATMQYNLATIAGREAFAEVKFYAETNEAEFSIGYKVPDGKARKRADGVRVIFQIDLFELSHVLFGAAPLSMALEVKSLDAATAGTVTAPALTPPKRTSAVGDDKPFPAAPELDETQPWDDDDKKKAAMESKTAAAVLLEAKSHTVNALEVKDLGAMKGSYEERRSLIEAAARDLFGLTYTNPCVCVVATYDTEVVVTLYAKDESRSYVLPYTADDDGIALGVPQAVELSLVAEKKESVAEEAQESFDDVEEVTIVGPMLSYLTQASQVAALESKVGALVRAKAASLFGGMSSKSADDTGVVADPVVGVGVITRETLPEGEWGSYRKTEPIEATRMVGAFSVQTREGVVHSDDGWLAIDSQGWPYPIAADEFDTIYVSDDEVAPDDEVPATEPELATKSTGDDTLSSIEPAADDAGDRVTLDPDEHFAMRDGLDTFDNETTQ